MRHVEHKLQFIVHVTFYVQNQTNSYYYYDMWGVISPSCSNSLVHVLTEAVLFNHQNKTWTVVENICQKGDDSILL